LEAHSESVVRDYVWKRTAKVLCAITSVERWPSG
jgi:hypothetical protein